MKYNASTRVLFTLTIIITCFQLSYGQQGDPPTAKYTGLEIYRSKLMKELISYDSSLVFKPTGKVDNFPQLSADGINNSHVEITGLEDNIRQVKYTIEISPDHDKGIKALRSIAYLLYSITGNDGVTWFYAQIKTMKDITTPIHTTTTINLANKLIFDYTPAQKSISITINSW